MYLFIHRSLWDSYMCGPLTPGASRIPDEFPKPEQPSSKAWERFLVKDIRKKTNHNKQERKK